MKQLKIILIFNMNQQQNNKITNSEYDSLITNSLKFLQQKKVLQLEKLFLLRMI